MKLVVVAVIILSFVCIMAVDAYYDDKWERDEEEYRRLMDDLDKDK